MAPAPEGRTIRKHAVGQDFATGDYRRPVR